ncbi:anti-sigma factor [Cellulomonas sp. zg-ZUI168]|nr:anti-sigma factor [Cellulomonas fengjieae]
MVPFDESHVDDDVIALLALGEPAGSASELAHLRECRRCTDELDALAEVAELARSSAADGPLVPPAPEVWDRVAAELGLGTPPAVVDLDSRRARPRAWRWVAAAAAVGVVVGGGGAWWAASRDEPVTVVATAVLDPLPGWDATGSAVVETRSDGSRVLVLDLDTTQTSDDGFREVWLLTPDVSGLVSVGTLAGSSGRFDLPEGLDLDEFSVVDVSEEQFDGDPAHSGESIVRGPLEA